MHNFLLTRAGIRHTCVCELSEASGLLLRSRVEVADKHPEALSKTSANQIRLPKGENKISLSERAHRLESCDFRFRLRVVQRVSHVVDGHPSTCCAFKACIGTLRYPLVGSIARSEVHDGGPVVADSFQYFSFSTTTR